MLDKFTAVSKSKLGEPIARLDNKDAVKLNRALMGPLGLASPPRASRSG
jgi:hypothetical protein